MHAISGPDNHFGISYDPIAQLISLLRYVHYLAFQLFVFRRYLRYGVVHIHIEIVSSDSSTSDEAIFIHSTLSRAERFL